MSEQPLKRHAALLPLSWQHQRGLRLARGIGLGEADVGDVERVWNTELEAHFYAEEELLFPFSEDAHAARVKDDHEWLRATYERLPAQAMIRQAVPFTSQGRSDWPRIERLVADYRNVSVPCLILWGSRDETFPASMGYKLRAQLPRAWLRVLPGCMHQLPAEAPRACAGQIRGFLTSAGKGWPRIVDGVVNSPTARRLGAFSTGDEARRLVAECAATHLLRIFQHSMDYMDAMDYSWA